jgi:hypothetical protein
MAPRTSQAERALALVVVLASAACATPVPAKKTAPPPRAEAPPCTIETTVASGKAPRDRKFPASYWFALLLPGYRSSGIVLRPATDCSGRHVTVMNDGCGKEAPVEAVPIDRLTEENLLIVDVEGATRLVWAMTDRLSDGQVQGPVGLVEITDRGLAVRALGVLRTYPERMTLRLARLGTGKILVAEGEHCGEHGTAETCTRAIRFLTLRGDRFVAAPMTDETDACLGSGFVALTASGTDPSSTDRYRLETSVSFGPDEITLREQLTISAVRTSAAGFMRQVRADRRLSFRDGHLVASAPALVSRWRAGTSAPPSK